MKRIVFTWLTAAVVAVLATTAARSAPAGEWMFKPSNYSHSPARGEDFGPNRFARGPYYTQTYGAYFRGGYRHLHSTISVRGQSWDHLNVFESWVQFGEQF